MDTNIAIESFIANCDNMMIAEEGFIKSWIEKHKKIKVEKKEVQINKKMEEEKSPQICIIHGLITTPKDSKDFEEFFLKRDIHIKWIECVETNDNKIHDTIFSVLSDDLHKMALVKTSLSVRWWEDVVSYNDNAWRYPKSILDKYPIQW